MLLGARKIGWCLCRQQSTNQTTSCRGWSGKPSSALSIGKSANGTSLFASKSITAGDCVLKVPYSCATSSG